MRKILFAGLAFLFLASCKGDPERMERTFSGFALGTTYHVTIIGDKVPDDFNERLEEVFRMADDAMSVFNPESQLNRINNNYTQVMGPHIEYLVKLGCEFSEMSGGKYDITVEPLLDAYGFSGSPPKENVNVDSLLKYVGYQKISIENGKLMKQYPETRIGLNSIAKGYTVDLVARMLDDNGITDYLVSIGGEIVCRGRNKRNKEWSVAIETPFEGNVVEGTHTMARIHVSDVGIATSGNYRNYRLDNDGSKYTHIIDPLTGENTVSSLLSATVVAENCARADAMATMFISLGLEGSLELMEKEADIAVLLIFEGDGEGLETYVSPKMKKYFESKGDA